MLLNNLHLEAPLPLALASGTLLTHPRPWMHPLFMLFVEPKSAAQETPSHGDNSGKRACLSRMNGNSTHRPQGLVLRGLWPERSYLHQPLPLPDFSDWLLVFEPQQAGQGTCAMQNPPPCGRLSRAPQRPRRQAVRAEHAARMLLERSTKTSCKAFNSLHSLAGKECHGLSSIAASLQET